MAAIPRAFVPVLLLLVACSAGDEMGTVPGGGGWVGSDAGPGSTTPRPEECNGLDDDADGSIDEECPCEPGARQACWPGEPARRGVGSCADGTQLCSGTDEFAVWGTCEGATLPSVEVPDNRLDEDCDGFDGDECLTPGGCTIEDPPGGGDGPGDGDPPGGGGSCAAGRPVLLVALDRTQSMHKNLQGNTPTNPARSKWAIAISALESTIPSFDSTIDLGLELFPRERDGCVMLERRLEGFRATNTACEEGEIVVAPRAGAASAIAAAIDPLGTALCNTTPIGLALGTASASLGAVSSARRRAVLLLTDGRETCESRPVEQAHALASAGILTYVVAFDEAGSIDERRLNNLACAGRTARGFDMSCIDEGGGRYVARDPAGPRLFRFANDEMSLGGAFRAVAAEVECR